jgi:23S rRNA pseudouridine2605 synthase
MFERLQKILSARGIASRRKAEEYITAGLVRVNGAVAQLGQKADPDKDTIEVSGTVIEDRAQMLYYLLWKPIGVVTSNVERWEAGDGKPMTKGKERAMKRRGGSVALPQPLRDKTTRDLLPEDLQGTIYPVGRLDKDSGGLLLFSNDGPLAYRLTHPKFDHEKEYIVSTKWDITDDALQRISEGMIILGKETKETMVQRIDPRSFRIILTEGRNRQIRRMVEKTGNRVASLVRTRIMNLHDPHLQPGELRPLTDGERKALLKAVGL